jgi:hypothetical protein
MRMASSELIKFFSAYCRFEDSLFGTGRWQIVQAIGFDLDALNTASLEMYGTLDIKWIGLPEDICSMHPIPFAQQ